MLNDIPETPREKPPRVTSAVVATIDDDEVFLVDLENAGPSMPSAFMPVIGGQGQWTHCDLTSMTRGLIVTPEAITSLNAFVSCLFVCLQVSVLNCLATQQHGVL